MEDLSWESRTGEKSRRRADVGRAWLERRRRRAGTSSNKLRPSTFLSHANQYDRVELTLARIHEDAMMHLGFYDTEFAAGLFAKRCASIHAFLIGHDALIQG
jgi:hypothetical protein